MGQTPTQLWMRQRYTLTADTIPLWELTLAFISATTAAFAIRANHWGMAFYAALFGAGLGYMAMVTLWQNWQIKRALRE